MTDVPTEVISKSYRSFCRLACAALVLVGLVVIIFSIRVSGITCRRSEGICQTFHLGLLAGPGHTFPIKDVTGVGFSERPHYTYDPIISQLRIYSCCGITSYWPITYTWVSSVIPLEPAADKIKHFLNDSSVPEVTIQVPDLRLNYLVIGIFFLSAGLIYAVTNSKAFKPGQYISAGSLVTQPDGHSFTIWLGWVLAPFISFLVLFYLLSFISAMGEIDQGIVGFLFNVLLIIVPCSVQAWVIHRVLNVKGYLWLISTLCSLAFIIWPAVSIVFIPTSSWGLVLSQGRFNPLGLGMGLVIGLFQWPVLRRRLLHASWWVLGCAMAGLFSVSTIFLSIWLSDWLSSRFVQVYSALNHFLELYLVCNIFLVYLGITGFVLVWLLKQGRTEMMERPNELHQAVE